MYQKSTKVLVYCQQLIAREYIFRNILAPVPLSPRDQICSNFGCQLLVNRATRQEPCNIDQVVLDPTCSIPILSLENPIENT